MNNFSSMKTQNIREGGLGKLKLLMSELGMVKERSGLDAPISVIIESVNEGLNVISSGVVMEYTMQPYMSLLKD